MLITFLYLMVISRLWNWVHNLNSVLSQVYTIYFFTTIYYRTDRTPLNTLQVIYDKWLSVIRAARTLSTHTSRPNHRVINTAHIHWRWFCSFGAQGYARREQAEWSVRADQPQHQRKRMQMRQHTGGRTPDRSLLCASDNIIVIIALRCHRSEFWIIFGRILELKVCVGYRAVPIYSNIVCHCGGFFGYILRTWAIGKYAWFINNYKKSILLYSRILSQTSGECMTNRLRKISDFVLFDSYILLINYSFHNFNVCQCFFSSTAKSDGVTYMFSGHALCFPIRDLCQYSKKKKR